MMWRLRTFLSAALIVYLQALFIGLVVEFPIWLLLKGLVRFGLVSKDAEWMLEPWLVLYAIGSVAALITLAIIIAYSSQTRGRSDQNWRFSRRHRRILELPSEDVLEQVIEALTLSGCFREGIRVFESPDRVTTITALSPHRRGHLKKSAGLLVINRQDWMRERNLRVTIRDRGSISEVRFECWPTLWAEYLDMTETSHYLLEHLVSLLQSRTRV